MITKVKGKMMKRFILLLFIMVIVIYIINTIVWEIIKDTIFNMILPENKIMLIYNYKNIQTNYISPDTYTYLTFGKRHLIRYNEINSTKKILIKNDDIYIEVHNKDDQSFYLYVELNKLIHPTYEVKGYGSFQKILNALYSSTQNNVFLN